MNRKNLRRLLAASLAVGAFTFAPNFYQIQTIQVVQAEVKMYSGVGEDYPSQIENLEVSRLRAVDKAVKAAVEKAGVALSAYSRAKNFNLTENEIVAITSNTYEIVGEPKCEKIIHQVTDVSAVVIWRVTVDVNVDDSEIMKWMRLDTKESSKILTRTQDNLRVAEENNAKVEELRQRLATESDKDKLKAEFEQADAEFLSNQKLAEGNRLYYKRKYSEAAEYFNESLKFNPNNAEALYMLGTIYSTFLKDKDKALEYFNKTIEIDPNYAKAYSMMGLICHYDLADKKKAQEHYNRAIEIGKQVAAQTPNDIENWFNLGEVYNNAAIVYDDKNLKKLAIDAYSKATEIEPNNKEAWLYLGTCYMTQTLVTQSKNYDKAIECFKKALAIDQNYLWAWNNMGIIYGFSLNQYDKGIGYFNKTLEIDPEFSGAYNSMGFIYKNMQNYSKSIEYYSKYVELNPNDVYGWTSLADLCKETKDYPKAAQCYEQALKIAPKDDHVWFSFAGLYSDMGNNQKAIEYYTKAIEINPRNQYYYTLRAYCYEAIGDKASARADRAKAKTLK